ncbi:prolyl oligopeptidase family protein [Micromonospora sp. Llam0]|uniref:S9 family peptidase n=1 Tax=Micromonospora sp. Llam0 TaxID=2485143 RepID=UPI000FA968E2|nr:prolyl oligopeptidase family serine peptidase [Micromonospora sp. Llam0]ROO52893.1 prolyl oligopeptidase family protein [Micromonospora sp. Llam0]
MSYDWLTGVDGALHWVESSPETGRAMVVTWRPEQDPSDVQISRLYGANVGSSLHAYGGMPYAIHPSAGAVMVSGSTGLLAVDIAATKTAHVYGDLTQNADELLCVREDDAGDELVAIDILTGGLRVLLATDGFLASPRTFAGRLAWTQWGRGAMPWDSSELWVAEYQPGKSIRRKRRIAGGPDESAVQPQWNVDGALYFLSDRSGWWNLYRWRDGQTYEIAPMAAECAAAPWESSYSNYVLLPGQRIGLVFQRGPRFGLIVVEPDGHMNPVKLPYTAIKPHVAAIDNRIALIGASPTRPQQIALVSTDGSENLEVVRESAVGVTESVSISVPEIIQVASQEADLTVLFYPPTGKGDPAPLIVRPHPGPTYHSDLRLDWEVQFFTSRGFAVADVDYRGSTGYGREFRKALDGEWGRLDVEDCRYVAMHLLATGRVCPGGVFISGASAGGFTALRAACEEGPFLLAVARSAIVDPVRWMTTAPRFQRPHAGILASDGARVMPDRVRCPVLLIHGDRDDVAPIDDVTELAAALDHRGLLAGMLALGGVGHYISTPAALSAALEAELQAYLEVIKSSGHSLPE